MARNRRPRTLLLQPAVRRSLRGQPRPMPPPARRRTPTSSGSPLRHTPKMKCGSFSARSRRARRSSSWGCCPRRRCWTSCATTWSTNRSTVRLVKKLPRYQQYRAATAAMRRILSEDKAEERGGVVWHTQGSGKSLTMLWLATKIRREPRLANADIVVVTDRTQLDKQISDTFRRCGFPCPGADGPLKAGAGGAPCPQTQGTSGPRRSPRPADRTQAGRRTHGDDHHPEV